VQDSNFGEGNNVSNNTLDDGSAIGTGAGNVTGGGNDTTNTTTTNTSTSTNVNENTNVNAHDSIVNTEQGPGDQQTQNDNSEDGFHEEPQVLRTELAPEHQEQAPEPQGEDVPEPA
jgi:hypothetical protein